MLNYREKWVKYFERMSNERLPKCVMKYYLKIGRDLGCQEWDGMTLQQASSLNLKEGGKEELYERIYSN